jgi:hypothetical protein
VGHHACGKKLFDQLLSFFGGYVYVDDRHFCTETIMTVIHSDGLYEMLT